MAFHKANSLKPNFPQSLILGGDQLIDFEGQTLGKPPSEEGAVQQLMKLSGKTHKLYTSICLLHPDGTTFEHTNLTLMTVKKLNKGTVQNYVQKYQTWETAGSYKYEHETDLIFESVVSEDTTSIIGIPTKQLITWLKQLKLINF